MKRLAILFIALVVMPPVVRGEQSPSSGTGGVSVPGVVITVELSNSSVYFNTRPGYR